MRDGSLSIRHDARKDLSALDVELEVFYNVDSGKHDWLQIFPGNGDLIVQVLSAEDGADINDEPMLTPESRRWPTPRGR